MQANDISVQQYVDGILRNDRAVLSRAITVVESFSEAHRTLKSGIVEGCLPYSGNSIRIGITGVPGVGKSTFIEALGKYLIKLGRKPAVLAIDPSSRQSGGSILGDKTRMPELAADDNAYIRPSPSSGGLGGVAASTREAIILCEAAGYDTIMVETMGVGQSETNVHSMVDFFLLLMLTGAGDELQGIKRGVMEMADAIVINKADGDNVEKAALAQAQLKNALHLFPPSDTGWTPSVETCSSTTEEGLGNVWQVIMAHHELANTKGFFSAKRKEQAKHWMYETIHKQLKADFYSDSVVKQHLLKFESEVVSGTLSPVAAAQKLMELYENATGR